MVSATAVQRATADDRPADPPRRPVYVAPPPSSILPYVSAGVALIGAAGSTIFFLDARRARRTADTHYPTDPAFAADRAHFRVERALGFTLAGVGAVGLGVLVYAWLRHDPARDRPRVGIGIGASGALVTFGGAL